MTAKTKNSAAQSPNRMVRMRLIVGADEGSAPDRDFAAGPDSVAALPRSTSRTLPIKSADAILVQSTSDVRKPSESAHFIFSCKRFRDGLRLDFVQQVGWDS